MSARGRGSRGGFSRGGRGRGGGRGGGAGAYYAGPPASVIEVGEVMHACNEELVCKCTLDEKVPYFNGRVFLENRQEIGKIDEILGQIRSFMFSVKMAEAVKAASFGEKTKLFIDPAQILPLSRFLPRPAGPQVATPKKPGLRTAARGGRGGRGGYARGGGFSRGGARGGFSRGGLSRGRGRGGF